MKASGRKASAQTVADMENPPDKINLLKMWGLSYFTGKRLMPGKECGQCRSHIMRAGYLRCSRAKTSDAQYTECPADFPACLLYESKVE
jgi:hypothetical protein